MIIIREIIAKVIRFFLFFFLRIVRRCSNVGAERSGSPAGW